MDSHKTDDAERGHSPAHPVGSSHASEPVNGEAPTSSARSERPHPASSDGDAARRPQREDADRTDATRVERAGGARDKPTGNNVRKIRTEKMMSKAELARRAGMSTLTIDRVERGMPCRMDTKRKILEALGLKPSDRVLVFGEED